MRFMFSQTEIIYFIFLNFFFITDYLYQIKLFNFLIINISFFEYFYCCYSLCLSYKFYILGLAWLGPITLIANNFVPVNSEDYKDIVGLAVLNTISDLSQSFWKNVRDYCNYKPLKNFTLKLY